MITDGLPSNLRELVTSESRRKIIEVIFDQWDAFTCRDICNLLVQQGIKAHKPSVLFCLKALCYRGYVKELPVAISKGKGRGRPMVMYVVLQTVKL